MPEDTQSQFEIGLISQEIEKMVRGVGGKAGIPIDDLDDFVQEVLSEAFQCIGKYNAACGTLKSWIAVIAKNRSVDLRRRNSAAKRRPKEGMISLNAKNGTEESPEIESGEVQSSSTSPVSAAVEVKALAAQTNLTEKEKHALAESLAGKSQGAKSRARVRRATSKMQMVAAADRASPAQPAIVECAYGKVTSAQQPAALIYELSRITPWFVEEIGVWRSNPKWERLMQQIANQKSQNVRPVLLDGSRWPRRIREALMQNDKDNYLDVRAAVELAAAFPEWPKTPFLAIDRREVEERLWWFGWSFGPMPVMEITDPIAATLISGGAKSVPKCPSPSEYTAWIDHSFPKRRPGAVKSTHIFRIEWDAPPATAMRCFGRWFRDLTKNHPISARRLAGRKRSGRLAALAAARLRDEFGLSEMDARHWLKCHYGAAAPINSESFQKALRMGRYLRRIFIPAPIEIRN
jgi:RNA polymerase sigma factor (sigma-70 family)